MIKTINSWRGLIAIAVVLFHCGVGWIYNVAVSGVTFFFISSAFLLAMRHPFERLTALEYRRFLLAHAARLYPLHWLGLALLIILALIFHTTVIDWGATALSFMLLHQWSPVHDVHYGLNPVSWFLGVLLFCYVIYPFLARWLARWRLRYKALLVASLAIILALVLYPLDIPRREAIFVNPLSHVLDVCFGLMLIHVYHILARRCRNLGFRAATLIELAAFLSLVAVIAVNMLTTWIRPWEDVIIWLLPSGCLVLAMALLNGREGAIGRVLLSRPLQWLGGISFEVFILQMVAFHLFNYVLAPVAGHFGLLVYSSLEWFALAVLLPLAWLVNRYFTRPLSARIKRALAQCDKPNVEKR